MWRLRAPFHRRAHPRTWYRLVTILTSLKMWKWRVGFRRMSSYSPAFHLKIQPNFGSIWRKARINKDRRQHLRVLSLIMPGTINWVLLVMYSRHTQPKTLTQATKICSVHSYLSRLAAATYAYTCLKSKFSTKLPFVIHHDERRFGGELRLQAGVQRKRAPIRGTLARP